VIGRLIDGFDVLNKIEGVPVGEKNKPVERIEIERMIIHANPIAEAEG
jgi:peptidyl-prolyl cis-trans isomerase-like 3